jgi:hypothetical protein
MEGEPEVRYAYGQVVGLTYAYSQTVGVPLHVSTWYMPWKKLRLQPSRWLSLCLRPVRRRTSTRVN